jgi:hypothetical protein
MTAMLALVSFLIAYMGLKEVSYTGTRFSCQLIFLAIRFLDFTT